jgi:hypothetical protein
LKNIIQSCGLTIVGLFLLMVPSRGENSGPVAKNSWRGLTPLRSSAEDVARTIGAEATSTEAMFSGPYAVDGGEVTFSYLTASLAKIYRAPRSMVGKVFTIYFKPSDPMSRTELTLSTGFKRCVGRAGPGVLLLCERCGSRLPDSAGYRPGRNDYLPALTD